MIAPRVTVSPQRPWAHTTQATSQIRSFTTLSLLFVYRIGKKLTSVSLRMFFSLMPKLSLIIILIYYVFQFKWYRSMPGMIFNIWQKYKIKKRFCENFAHSAKWIIEIPIKIFFNLKSSLGFIFPSIPSVLINVCMKAVSVELEKDISCNIYPIRKIFKMWCLDVRYWLRQAGSFTGPADAASSQ